MTVLVGCGDNQGARGGQSSPIKDISLKRLGGGAEVSLSACPAAKCLTVTVAPWCGYCRRSTAMIRALGEYLKRHNVATRVIVSKDEDAALRSYAQEFGPDALLDPESKIEVNGVPHFLVTDAQGRVLTQVAGAPAGVQEPFNDEKLARVAKLFELP